MFLIAHIRYLSTSLYRYRYRKLKLKIPSAVQYRHLNTVPVFVSACKKNVECCISGSVIICTDLDPPITQQNKVGKTSILLFLAFFTFYL
jgi:hypothetical protein